VLNFRPLVFVGTFSYSLYLMHAPLLQLLWQYWLYPSGIGRQAMFVCLLTLGLAIVLGASYLFHLLFEAPFMGAQRSARKAAAPVAEAP
jgi:peptidoglycan/LPS O-acetylase OafA/YrhL